MDPRAGKDLPGLELNLRIRDLSRRAADPETNPRFRDRLQDQIDLLRREREQIYLHDVLTIHCGALLEDSDPHYTLVCLKPPGHPGKHYDRDFRRYWTKDQIYKPTTRHD